MEKFEIKNPAATLETLGIKQVKNAHWNLSPEALVQETIRRGQGFLTDLGAIAVETGEFTGRSPQDRFIVEDAETKDTVDWGNINKPIDNRYFQQLKGKIIDYFADKDVFVRDAYVCADDDYRMNLRLVSEYPWSNQFAYNMFLRPTGEELENFEPEWSILCAPGFHADPEVDGTRQHNFAIINFTEKQIIIGGTGYTGEIKKGIFSVLNYVLPKHREVLSMHCSANVGQEGDTAVFFGLSGTGKTTLSADPNRNLIGDDEHGWSENGIFNFEGGCYAKTIDLSEEKEPEIYHAIKHRAILENIKCYPGTRTPDFENSDITENTRVSYPIYHIDNALEPSRSGHPTNIFFLTCDAFGVLPPISKLTPGQAMYHFMSGYTAKVAGTEAGITEPQATFSACFGAPFMPLHPAEYAEMLGEKMQAHNVNVWLVNTGWTGGAYGTGHRMSLKYTRAMITAALRGELDDVDYHTHEIFGLSMPVSCPNVPDEVLDPKQTWADSDAYDAKANDLAERFNKNFEKFAAKTSDEILAAAPKVLAS
ncbi:MAG: phosphoenolpyruvate carboxykinase (ATP) [Phaeodactylibacter xiamenensis]|uniref:Phosphoenolpyruvate carboxykinase (ATP) n=1 Tax=Phaeodactylibacter xiamenensis TaxID=1524460 RepID=A0A098S5M6_9BACT|nr:phosphoenolpyruvate carboxykinase (ATP) [Phaeodactylibacter xiamenensis]KGE87118.1 phosphoenolpyruvate carboxykinase [Phaeodactylibacter xiamenensis]MCR9054714.1 phosphoenolpyruvate carboxykinase (ATP) [bacterium]